MLNLSGTQLPTKSSVAPQAGNDEKLLFDPHDFPNAYSPPKLQKVIAKSLPINVQSSLVLQPGYEVAVIKFAQYTDRLFI